MRSSVRRHTGSTGARRLAAAAMVLTLPLGLAACSDEDGDSVGTDDGPVTEIQEEDTD